MHKQRKTRNQLGEEYIWYACEWYRRKHRALPPGLKEAMRAIRRAEMMVTETDVTSIKQWGGPQLYGTSL